MIYYKGEFKKPGECIPVDIYQNGIWNDSDHIFEEVLVAKDVMLKIAPPNGIGSSDRVIHAGQTWGVIKEGIDHFIIVI